MHDIHILTNCSMPRLFVADSLGHVMRHDLGYKGKKPRYFRLPAQGPIAKRHRQWHRHKLRQSGMPGVQTSWSSDYAAAVDELQTMNASTNQAV